MTRRHQSIHFDIHRGKIPQCLDNLQFLHILPGLQGIRFDLENTKLELFAIMKILVSLTYKKEEESEKEKVEPGCSKFNC